MAIAIPPELLQRCWFLAGPTAGGKTAASLLLAERLDAEVISLDSMAIYRGMDIGTAKPNAEDRRRIRHHLIDVAEPHQEFSVAEYLQLAWNAVQEIIDRGHVPLFVGGTGLYLRSMLRGVFDGPEADNVLRAQLEEQLQQHGNQWLHDQLRLVDPVTADRLHLNDIRRIIRAIEVCRSTGQPLSAQQTQLPLPAEQRPMAVLWLNPPRPWLHDRINRRVDQMMQDGLLEETRQLLSNSPAPSRTAMQALGYRELAAHLQDDLPLQAAIEQIKGNTRQFARRQHTWFRNLEECTSLDISGHESTEQLVDRLLAAAALTGSGNT